MPSFNVAYTQWSNKKYCCRLCPLGYTCKYRAVQYSMYIKNTVQLIVSHCCKQYIAYALQYNLAITTHYKIVWVPKCRKVTLYQYKKRSQAGSVQTPSCLNQHKLYMIANHHLWYYNILPLAHFPHMCEESKVRETCIVFHSPSIGESLVSHIRCGSGLSKLLYTHGTSRIIWPHKD